MAHPSTPRAESLPAFGRESGKSGGKSGNRPDAAGTKPPDHIAFIHHFSDGGFFEGMADGIIYLMAGNPAITQTRDAVAGRDQG